NAASTNTGLAASSATSTFGEPVTLTATVDSPDSPSTPTGTVTFRAGTTVLGTPAVDGAGVASLTTGAIATGSRTLTAQYNGAAGFTGSTSAGLAQTVNPTTVKVTASDTPDPSVFGTTVVIDVTVAAVAPGAGVPTGSVVIREGATTLATVTLDGSGHASANLDGLTVGAHTLTADYLGDGSYAAGSTSTGHNVGADTATLDLASSSTNVEYTDPVTFTATVTGTGGATPTGTVTFHIGSTVLGVVALNGAGVAQVTLSTFPFGTSVVVADYSGDAGFGTAPDHVNQTVNATETAVDLSVSPPAPTVTDLVTLTATVVGTSTSVVPAGSVTVFGGTTALGTAPVDGSGQATWSQRFDRTVHSLTARFT